MAEAQTRLPWTAEEDAVLIDLVQKYGEKRWNMVANGLPGRTGKGCSHRWRTYLRPDVKHPHLEPFTEWEAAVIVQAQREMGNNWLAIAKLLLPGRSNTAVKNFWHCRLKSGSGTHTNRFIVENYNLRYLMNEVPEKDKLHPVALPAFPSTAPTGHVRRQIHPRPRQEAAAAAAAMAEAQQIAAQMAAQAMAMDPSQAYMQQGMMDPTGAYAGMYGSYDGSQVAMTQQGYGAMQPPSFSSKEEMKQHASSYVQQQLAMMGHQPSSRGGSSSSKRDSAAGYSIQDMSYSGAAWQGGGYGQEGTAAAAAAAAAAAPTGVKKTGRGRGRPPGSKNQNNISKALDNAAAAAAAASAVEQQQLYQHQQQYSMNARASQDEAATWCSTGMMLAGSAAGAGAPTGSPATDMHSSANYMMSLPNSNTAPAAATDLLDPAALAAAPVPLAPGAIEASTSGLTAADAAAAAAAATAGGSAAAAGSDGITAGMPECNGLLPTSAAAAAELNKLPLANQFRVSMSGLDFELDPAGAANSMRFSARSLKLFEVEDGPCMPHYKASIGSMDFRTSLTSFDDLLGGQATNRMSDHTHIALRGPSWDGGSPNSRPSDDTAAAAGAAVPSADVAAAAATGYANGSSSADDALAVAFRQQQQQQALMPPPGSCGMMAGTWVAAQQPPNSAAAAAAAGPPALPNSLSGVASGPMAIPSAAPMQEEIHPGAIAAPAAVAAAMGAAVPGGETPFGSARLQAAPFSPVSGAAAAAVLAGPPDLLAPPDSQAADQATLGPCLGGAAAAGAAAAVKAASRAPPPAPRMPLAFHSVLQALQPPAAACSGSNAAAGGTTGAAATGMPGIKQEPLQHPQAAQQQPRCDVALAAASPAITGISAATCKAPVPSFTMPAAATAAGSSAGLHQQQQQMPMPMPLPPQLLLPPQQQQPQAVLHRISDLALPSPIDLFHGDHGLHPDDLLIDAETVFDEQMLLASHQQQQQRGRMPLEAAALQHMHFAAAAADSIRSQAGPAAAVIGGSTTAVSPADALGSTAGAAVSSAGHPAASAAADPGPGPAGDKQGQKRRRSSTNGSSWGKKHRPSEGSLVEVYGTGNGIDDCLNFWHD